MREARLGRDSTCGLGIVRLDAADNYEWRRSGGRGRLAANFRKRSMWSWRAAVSCSRICDSSERSVVATAWAHNLRMRSSRRRDLEKEERRLPSRVRAGFCWSMGLNSGTKNRLSFTRAGVGKQSGGIRRGGGLAK